MDNTKINRSAVETDPLPLFSIIIPTYNRANLLPKAIESVIAQRYDGWELIIVDDGSTDDTAVVCQNFQSDVRIKYIFQQNKELNGARNTGVQNAVGTFCCFLDDDDYYLPNHLETIKAVIETQPGFGIYQTETLIKRGNKIISVPTKTKSEDALIELWTQPGNLLPLAIHSVLLKQQPFNEQDLLLDDFMWLNEALTKTDLLRSEQSTAVYVEHEANRTKTYHSIARLPRMIARFKEAYAVEGVAERVPEVLLQKRIHHLHLHLAHQLGRQGYKREAIAIWIQGIRSTGNKFWQKSAKSLIKIITGIRR